ncbi:MAG: glycosyltransferase family 2 protein [Hyphomonadaceae bacterium]|nr:glycosyltransferase family 2 protein [Hyphomonadaceae bacterium]
MNEFDTSKINVTVVVPTKNEEHNLPACLAALGRFHSVLVVDSGSDDRTLEIASDGGAEILQFNWDGRFPKKRNWTLRNFKFQTDWVIFLDADEVVDDAFCNELSRAINETTHVGFWLNYTNYFMGRSLMHGVPQRKLACFKHQAGEYERIDEEGWSSLDMEVHEHPVLTGTVGEIKAPIDHRDFRGLARFLQRHIDYAKWEASRYIQLKSDLEARSSVLTSRQTFKYQNIEKPWFAWFYFFYTYIGKGGFMDGRAGYQYASYKKWYFQTVRNIILEQSG